MTENRYSPTNLSLNEPFNDAELEHWIHTNVGSGLPYRLLLTAIQLKHERDALQTALDSWSKTKAGQLHKLLNDAYHRNWSLTEEMEEKGLKAPPRLLRPGLWDDE